jgi:hypothetical protein
LIEIRFLTLLLLILLSLLLHTLRVRAGKSGRLRPLPGLEDLHGLAAGAVETGRPLHVSVGVAGVGGVTTAETWAGLTLLGQLADQAAACDARLIVTVADPTVLPLAQDTLQRAYIRHGRPESYDPTQVRLIAPDPMAYAAGTMGLLDREPLAGNVMVGSFGDEYLLIGETGARRRLRQVVGTADPRTLPLVYATADEALLGEEMFATGAYTSRLPMQVGSLLTQDWIRWVLVVAILVAAVWNLLT